MKKIVFFCLGLFFASSTFAQQVISCGPSSNYSRILNIGNGIIAIYDPGVWAAQGQTHFIDFYSDGDQVCKFLGYSSVVAKTPAYSGGQNGHLINIKADGSWVIEPLTTSDNFIAAIHCR